MVSVKLITFGGTYKTKSIQPKLLRHTGDWNRVLRNIRGSYGGVTRLVTSRNPLWLPKLTNSFFFLHSLVFLRIGPSWYYKSFLTLSPRSTTEEPQSPYYPKGKVCQGTIRILGCPVNPPVTGRPFVLVFAFRSLRFVTSEMLRSTTITINIWVTVQTSTLRVSDYKIRPIGLWVCKTKTRGGVGREDIGDLERYVRPVFVLWR